MDESHHLGEATFGSSPILLLSAEFLPGKIRVRGLHRAAGTHLLLRAVTFPERLGRSVTLMRGALRPLGQQPDPATAGTRRFVPLLPTVAAVLGFVMLALAVGYFALVGLGHQLTPVTVLLEGTLFVAFGGVGVVLTLRQPRNRIGWILLGCIIVLALGGIGARYAVLAYRLGYHELPLAAAALVLGNSVQVLALLMIPVIILLFPDGRLPGPRWRWLLWVHVGFGACAMALTIANAIAPVVSHDVRIDSSGNLTGVG